MFTRLKEIIYLLTTRIPTTIYGKYITRNLIKVHWGRGLNNFGDCLQQDTLRHYGLTPVFVSSMEKAQIVMAGSILQLLSDDYRGIIIGTGGDSKKYNFHNAFIVGVRGKKTRDNLPPPFQTAVY